MRGSCDGEEVQFRVVSLVGRVCRPVMLEEKDQELDQEDRQVGRQAGRLAGRLQEGRVTSRQTDKKAG